jgi:membrane protein DedA with SNARE-associated domain
MAASAGAIVGDSIGYLAGRRWGNRMFDLLARRFPKHAGPDHLAYTKHMFARHGVWAVSFGRFVALLRIFAGPVAGALRMPYPRFLAANAAGGLFWACGTTTAVYTLGASVDRWLKEASWVGLAVAIGVGIAVSTVFRRRLAEAVARHAAKVASHGVGSPVISSQKMPPDGPGGELVP